MVDRVCSRTRSASLLAAGWSYLSELVVIRSAVRCAVCYSRKQFYT